MDADASSMIGQGNSYLSEMAEQGKEVRRHNQDVKDKFATAISLAGHQGGELERKGKLEKYSQGFAQMGADLGARALAIQKAGGVSEYLQQAPIYKGAKMVKEGGESLVEGAKAGVSAIKGADIGGS